MSDTACRNSTPTPPLETSQTAPPVDATDFIGVRPGVVPTTRVEPPPVADRPDGSPPKPDTDLTDSDLTSLLTRPASAASTADSCTAGGMHLSLTGSDVAPGHRYARLIVENTTDRACQLVGWPGLGLRGEWGTAFAIVAERSITPVDWIGVPSAELNTATTVPADGRAAADFEWTGALGGNRDEHGFLMAVQLSADETPGALMSTPLITSTSDQARPCGSAPGGRRADLDGPRMSSRKLTRAMSR